MLYLMIARSCFECNKASVRLMSTEPNEEDKESLIDLTGNGYCVKVHVIRLCDDGDAISIVDFYGI